MKVLCFSKEGFCWFWLIGQRFCRKLSFWTGLILCWRVWIRLGSKASRYLLWTRCWCLSTVTVFMRCWKKLLIGFKEAKSSKREAHRKFQTLSQKIFSSSEGQLPKLSPTAKKTKSLSATSSTQALITLKSSPSSAANSFSSSALSKHQTWSGIWSITSPTSWRKTSNSKIKTQSSRASNSWTFSDCFKTNKSPTLTKQ